MVTVFSETPTNRLNSGNQHCNCIAKWPQMAFPVFLVFKIFQGNAVPLVTTDAKTIASKLIERFISVFGVPTHLHSDQGS